jgi:hypothetical protein
MYYIVYKKFTVLYKVFYGGKTNISMIHCTIIPDFFILSALFPLNSANVSKTLFIVFSSLVSTNNGSDR